MPLPLAGAAKPPDQAGALPRHPRTPHDQIEPRPRSGRRPRRAIRRPARGRHGGGHAPPARPAPRAPRSGPQRRSHARRTVELLFRQVWTRFESWTVDALTEPEQGMRGMLAELPPPGDVRISQANNPNVETPLEFDPSHQALAACCVKLPIRAGLDAPYQRRALVFTARRSRLLRRRNASGLRSVRPAARSPHPGKRRYLC